MKTILLKSHLKVKLKNIITIFCRIVKFSNHEIIFAPQNIRTAVNKLGDFYDLSQGVVEASDKISSKQFKKINRMDVNVGDGIFVLNSSEFETLGLSSLEKSFVVKYLDPNDVSSYKITPKNPKNT